jgi:hypothetical protein
MAVPGEDGPGQGVGQGVVAERKGLREASVVLDKDAEHGPEDFLLRGCEVRVPHLHSRGDRAWIGS